MKKLVVVIPFLLLVSCSSAPRPVVNSNQSTVNAASQSNEVKSVLSHSSEGQSPRTSSNDAPGKWSRSGDPVDTRSFDAKIASAEKTYKSKPSDDAAKKELAEAYFERGFALTEARQYASAIGDYRRALKLDPTHEEAKKWIDQILEIYSTIKKQAPAEGEEPAPLPLKKES
ncbi:MAG TPA: tetratricopeptide repeat protein [Pyrinomonadaceae bacterium]|nr:tetratricopeptide repeat protein [Pyrinomonadaceae bacterium]